MPALLFQRFFKHFFKLTAPLHAGKLQSLYRRTVHLGHGGYDQLTFSANDMIHCVIVQFLVPHAAGQCHPQQRGVQFRPGCADRLCDGACAFLQLLAGDHILFPYRIKQH